MSSLKTRFVFTLALLLSSFICSAQIPDGLYKSSKISYRSNYFLKVKGKRFTLYGWEKTAKNDSLYFRTTAQIDSKNSLSFRRFEFQKERITASNIRSFKADESLSMDPAFLYRHIMNIKFSNGRISLIATKDSYLSRADTFYFEK